MRTNALGTLSLILVLGAACASGLSAKEKETVAIHHDLAVEALRTGRFDEALRYYELALQMNDAMAEAHLGKGIVLEFGFGRIEEAEAEYRRALELRPGFSEAHNNLGQLQAKRGDLEESLKSFDRALSNLLYKESFIARCNKGEALYQMGRRLEGISEIKACLGQNRRYCQGHRVLGRIYLEEGKVKEALEELSAYAQACERVADAHYQLGLAHIRAGDAEQAKLAFEKCESLGRDTDVADSCRKSRERLQ
jgi:Tfp pilus assembly protein PilF